MQLYLVLTSDGDAITTSADGDEMARAAAALALNCRDLPEGSLCLHIADTEGHR